MVPVEDIIDRILPEFREGLKTRPVPKESLPVKWPRRRLRFPQAKPWNVELNKKTPPAFTELLASCVQPVWKDGKILLAGPNLFACFSGNMEEPAWLHCSTVPLRFERKAATAPAPFAPHLEGDRVYTGWGIENTGALGFFPRVLTHLAAFDVSNGRPVWTTRQTRGWKNVSPISDPVVTDGRVYVLAVESRHPALAASFFLVNLDAATGSLFWKRRLVTASMHMRGRAARSGGLAVNVTRFGGALAVVRGSVYCQTSAGAFIRCDARDGLIEWARGYLRDTGTLNLASILRREGGCPVVFENIALFLPRDSVFLHAVSVESGKLVWEVPQRESRRLLGRCGGKAILAGDHCLRAVEIASGKVAWEKTFQQLVARPQLLDEIVYAGDYKALFAIDGGSGEILGKRPWEGTRPRQFVIAGGSLITVENERP